MNVLCEFNVPYKGKDTKCKLTMKDLIGAQTALGISGFKELGVRLEQLDVLVTYMIIKHCVGDDCEVIELYDEDIEVIQLSVEFLSAILELFDTGKKKKPLKKKAKKK
jgi:hypothetical protein